MVSAGTVSGDLNNITTLFSTYSSQVSELASCWKGDSYNNFNTKTSEFASNYQSTIKDGMTAFQEAVTAYEQYKNKKDNMQIAKSNYDKAVAAKDNANATTFSNEYNTLASEVETLKSQIQNALSSAKGAVLEAQSNSVEDMSSGKTISGGNASSTIQGAIDWAIAIAADDSHGYSQTTRNGNPNYDCSSLVINAYEAAGVPVKEAGAGYTGNMKSAFTSVGFEWIPGNPSMDSLQPGDVLLNRNSHTEMYVGNGMNVGAHLDYDGVNGDSSGKEINVQKYHGPWEGILRYVGDGAASVQV